MGQYIGARYVPKFMGVYDPTQMYEALDVVDNGLGTSYITKIPTPAGTPLTNTTYWAIYGATSGAIINLQNQIDDMKDGDVPGSLQNQIDDMKDGDVPGSLQEQINTNTSDITALTTHANFINPDDYTGTDTQKLQSAIDDCGHDGGTIVITRDYVLNGDIDLKVYTLTHSLKFVGLGGSITLGNYKFYSSLAANRNFSGADFLNITFKDISLVGFDADTLIRCTFIGCTFINTTGVIVKAIDYVQQFVFDDCHILGTNNAINTGLIIECKDVLSVQISNCRCESLKGVIASSGAAHNLLIIGCTIESITDTTIILGIYGYGVNISSNYFEIIASGKYCIDISGLTASAIAITSNYFKASTGYTNKFALFPSGNARAIVFYGNSFPVGGTVKYEISGTNGTLRLLNELCGNGGDVIDTNNQIPIYAFMAGGCTVDKATSYPYRLIFASDGMYSNSISTLRGGAPTIVSARLADGTTLNEAHFVYEADNDITGGFRCSNATTRGQIAGKMVYINIKWS